jgi:hypothetical protein
MIVGILFQQPEQSGFRPKKTRIFKHQVVYAARSPESVGTASVVVVSPQT